MALDGVFLSLVRKELAGCLIGARVDKIHQPSRDNLMISLRTISSGTKAFLLSLRRNCKGASDTKGA